MSDPRYRTKRWRQARELVLRRDGRRCRIPGCTADMTKPGVTSIDHIVEVKDGGDFWDPNNHQVLCKAHHNAKTFAVKVDRLQPKSPNA